MADRDSKTEQKTEWHLLPFDALELVAKVLMGGKKHYGPNDWREEPHFKIENVYDSLQRHIQARVFEGELYDKDSGQHHAAHIVANALFMLYYDMYGLWDKDSEVPLPPLNPKDNDEGAWDEVPYVEEENGEEYIPGVIGVEVESPQIPVEVESDLGRIREQMAKLWSEQISTKAGQLV